MSGLRICGPVPKEIFTDPHNTSKKCNCLPHTPRIGCCTPSPSSRAYRRTPRSCTRPAHCTAADTHLATCAHIRVYFANLRNFANFPFQPGLQAHSPFLYSPRPLHSSGHAPSNTIRVNFANLRAKFRELPLPSRLTGALPVPVYSPAPLDSSEHAPSNTNRVNFANFPFHPGLQAHSPFLYSPRPLHSSGHAPSNMSTH
jgi:hypothetical protein